MVEKTSGQGKFCFQEGEIEVLSNKAMKYQLSKVAYKQA
jgi:hypothetical protein